MAKSVKGTQTEKNLLTSRLRHFYAIFAWTYMLGNPV